VLRRLALTSKRARRLPDGKSPRPADVAEGSRLRRGAGVILIVDDTADTCEIYSLYLSGRGFKVPTARDGLVGLDAARRLQPDVIVMDLSMPGLDGWEVFEHLKANSNTANIPCVAVTAHTDQDRVRALKSGFSAFVGKPFRTEELLRTVAQLVGSK